MSSSISDVPAGFAPLVKLDLPSPEEYRKRKVALISGASSAPHLADAAHSRLRYAGITGQDGSYL